MSELEEEIKRSEMFANLLRRTCDALKGEPPELTLYSWHDLPEVGLALRKKNEDVLRVIDSFMKDPDPAYAYEILCDISDVLKDKAKVLDNGMVVRYTDKGSKKGT